MALARLGGSESSMRCASMRATRALKGSPSAAAASRNASQKTGSRLIDVAWPAIITERLTGPEPVIARSECDEAIQSGTRAMLDCFASLAMTGNASPASIHVLAAVDRQSRAGDEAAFFRAEEGDAAGNLVGPPEPADRNAGNDLLEHVGRHRRDHLGVDIAGRDRVDRDAGARAFLGQRLGETV